MPLKGIEREKRGSAEADRRPAGAPRTGARRASGVGLGLVLGGVMILSDLRVADPHTVAPIPDGLGFLLVVGAILAARWLDGRRARRPSGRWPRRLVTASLVCAALFGAFTLVRLPTARLPMAALAGATAFAVVLGSGVVVDRVVRWIAPGPGRSGPSR